MNNRVVVQIGMGTLPAINVAVFTHSKYKEMFNQLTNQNHLEQFYDTPEGTMYIFANFWMLVREGLSINDDILVNHTMKEVVLN